MPKPLSFAQMSASQQRKLFMSAARQALPQWRLGAIQLDWISYSTNAVFRVRSASRFYVLRLHAPGAVAEEHLRSELWWLRAIRRRTSLLAPLPLRTNEGSLFAVVSLAGLAPIYCVLFEHLPGRGRSAADLTANDLGALGSFLARLHTEAQIKPGAAFTRHRLDHAGVCGVESAYYVAGAENLLPANQRAILQAVSERIAKAMAKLDETDAGFGLIHGDLLAKNILFDGASAAALDFEFCAWGYFLYDLAPILWELKGERAADYAQLEDALWQGYTSHGAARACQREHLETMLAARQLLSCRWLLLSMSRGKLGDIAPALIDARCQELKDFLSSGILARATATL